MVDSSDSLLAIKNLKIGEKYTLIIDKDHQEAHFTKLSKNEILELIKSIPPEGVVTDGFCSDLKGKIKCYACKKEQPVKEYKQHDFRSIYSLDYVCDNCECSVYFRYDWSGPWD
jgi:hypothetical protein